jgi:hypothetical protein
LRYEGHAPFVSRITLLSQRNDASGTSALRLKGHTTVFGMTILLSPPVEKTEQHGDSTQLNPSSARSDQESDYRDEQRRANNRPDNGKVCASEIQNEDFRQPKSVGQPGPEQGANKTNGNGDKAAAMRIATDGLTN